MVRPLYRQVRYFRARRDSGPTAKSEVAEVVRDFAGPLGYCLELANSCVAALRSILRSYGPGGAP